MGLTVLHALQPVDSNLSEGLDLPARATPGLVRGHCRCHVDIPPWRKYDVVFSPPQMSMWIDWVTWCTVIFLFISTDKQRQERYYSFIPRSEPAIRVDVKNVGCQKCTDFITLSKVIQKIFFRVGRGWSQVAISWSTGHCWRPVVIMFCVKITARQIVRHQDWLS